MQTVAKIASLITLGLVIVPCLLYFTSTLELSTVKMAALVGTIGWFAATPLWMGRKLSTGTQAI